MKIFIKRYFFIGLLLCDFTFGASFECNKAVTNIEKTICENEDISRLDDELNKIYSALLNQYATYNDSDYYINSIKKHQHSWLKVRNACSDTFCLKNEYNSRNKELLMRLDLEHKNMANVDTIFYGPISHMVLQETNNMKFCKKAQLLLKDDPACRPHNNDNGHELCGYERAFSITLNGKDTNVFKEISTNEYGYTQIFKSNLFDDHNYSIIYLQKFKGDRHPRLTQTWKISSTKLQDLLRLPPGPISYEQMIKMKPRIHRDTNSEQFSNLLKTGKKLSDEWSPVVKIEQDNYIIIRECNGQWMYGGYYSCNDILSLTIKKIENHGDVIPICHFTKP